MAKGQLYTVVLKGNKYGWRRGKREWPGAPVEVMMDADDVKHFIRHSLVIKTDYPDFPPKRKAGR